jgi:hypothetical protein
MGREFFVGLLFFCLVFTSYGQALSSPDSVTAEKAPKFRFVFNFDTRYTLLENDRARISGLKTGIEWKNKYRAGLGYYFLSSPIVTKLPATIDQAAVEARVKLAYAAVYGEYVLVRSRKWEVSTPVQLGFGLTRNQYQNNKGETISTARVPLWLIEPSVSGHYKVYSWAGIGAGAGYRQVLCQANRETSQLNAPIYYIKAKFFVGELYRQFRKNRLMATEEAD